MTDAASPTEHERALTGPLGAGAEASVGVLLIFYPLAWSRREGGRSVEDLTFGSGPRRLADAVKEWGQAGARISTHTGGRCARRTVVRSASFVATVGDRAGPGGGTRGFAAPLPLSGRSVTGGRRQFAAGPIGGELGACYMRRMRFIYSYLVLAMAVGCGDEFSHQQPGTSEETASEAPASTTDSAEPASTTSPTSTGGVEPNSGETSTTGEAEAEDTDDTVGSSTTSAASDTDDTASATEPASDTEAPAEETTGGSDPQPCVGAAVPVKAEVIAYLESQIGDGVGEPGRLYLRFSSQSFTCADPHEDLACGHNWEVSLQIPAEFLVPGVHALADGPIVATAKSNGGGDVCEEAGGAVSGTLEIDAVDDGSVTGRLCHLRAFVLEEQILLDGTFEAPRCPQ